MSDEPRDEEATRQVDDEALEDVAAGLDFGCGEQATRLVE